MGGVNVTSDALIIQLLGSGWPGQNRSAGKVHINEPLASSAWATES